MILAVTLALLCAAPANAAEAPGAPGAVANWTDGDKDGFGSARPLASKVWFTLQGGELTEVYAPDLGTPSYRDLQFVVSDGRTFSERETDAAHHATRLADARSLTYRQTSSTRRWRLTKTYVTDPARSAVLMRRAGSSRSPASRTGCTCSATRHCRTPATTTARAGPPPTTRPTRARWRPRPR